MKSPHQVHLKHSHSAIANLVYHDLYYLSQYAKQSSYSINRNNVCFSDGLLIKYYQEYIIYS